MTVVVIVGVLLLGLYIGGKISGRFSIWMHQVTSRAVDRRLRARTDRLRGQAIAEGRQVGSDARPGDRVKAGVVDGAVAVGAGLLFALGYGLETVTTYGMDPVSGQMAYDTSTQLSFSVWMWLLASLAVYAADGARAAWRDGQGQTFGHKLFDYAPRSAAGEQLHGAAALRRHMLRLAAAPQAAAAAFAGQLTTPEHDRWTGTRAQILGGAPVPVGDMQAAPAI